MKFLNYVVSKLLIQIPLSFMELKQFWRRKLETLNLFKVVTLPVHTPLIAKRKADRHLLPVSPVLTLIPEFISNLSININHLSSIYSLAQKYLLLEELLQTYKYDRIIITQFKNSETS